MKAILEFNFDDYGDRLAHKRAVNATNVYIAIHEYSNIIRKIEKYDNLDENQFQMLSILKNNFYQILQENEVNLDDLE